MVILKADQRNHNPLETISHREASERFPHRKGSQHFAMESGVAERIISSAETCYVLKRYSGLVMGGSGISRYTKLREDDCLIFDLAHG